MRFERSGNWHMKVATLGRGQKRLIMVAVDLLALPLALWSAYALRFADVWPHDFIAPFWWLFVITPFAGIFIFARLGLYRAIVRYMGLQALITVVKGSCLLALLMWIGMYFYGFEGFPRSVPINFALVTLVYVGGTRFLVRSYYLWLVRHYADKEPVFIYGAGGAGVQLAIALENGREFYPLGFIDDDPALLKSTVQGIQVYPPEKAVSVMQEHGATRVLLAMPNATKKQRKQVLDLFQGHPIHVQTVPSMPEIVSGEASVDQLREVELEDLLGRDPVPPKLDLLHVSVLDKVVLVTGAGGSIGSELCRQIIRIKPKALLLYEMNEYSLYSIDQELAEIARKEEVVVPVYALLGSVCNRVRFEAIVRQYQVQTIYHAAAYKHVPIVEHNVFEGIRNNIFGTLVVAETAKSCKVERCVLVSTDKAVRPTNTMGATKRFAELILQGLAREATGTIFSMVRFGNVLGSSGSVVPLFRKQIAEGGPVTVTHPEITRFFMTIPEASLLVIQAGSMATGGEVFVLDMGEPVRIEHLARRMIELSGLEVRDENNPEGDVEVIYTGLRPGEKLYEELLIGENASGTPHPKIMRAREEAISDVLMQEYLDALRKAEMDQDCSKARAVLEVAVIGFTPSSPIVDWTLTGATPDYVVH